MLISFPSVSELYLSAPIILDSLPIFIPAFKVPSKTPLESILLSFPTTSALVQGFLIYSLDYWSVYPHSFPVARLAFFRHMPLHLNHGLGHVNTALLEDLQWLPSPSDSILNPFPSWHPISSITRYSYSHTLLSSFPLYGALTSNLSTALSFPNVVTFSFPLDHCLCIPSCLFRAPHSTPT